MGAPVAPGPAGAAGPVFGRRTEPGAHRAVRRALRWRPALPWGGRERGRVRLMEALGPQAAGVRQALLAARLGTSGDRGLPERAAAVSQGRPRHDPGVLYGVVTGLHQRRLFGEAALAFGEFAPAFERRVVPALAAAIGLPPAPASADV